MAKYILIEVANREINHEVFDNLDDAKTALRSLYEETCNSWKLDPNDYLDDVYWISEDNIDAYLNTDDCLFDWTIIEA